MKKLFRLFRIETEKTDDEIIKDLLAGVPQEDRVYYETIVRNQLNYQKVQLASSQTECKKCGEPVSTSQIGTSQVTKLLTPLSVQIIKKLLVLKNFVGIQPLQGPVGLIYKLRYHSEEDDRLSLEINSQAVEAGSRKLRAGWTIEAMNDLAIQHGLDIEKEMLKAISSEVADEFVHEIVTKITELGRQHHELESEYDNLPLIARLDIASNFIARETRRGAGNFVIVSPEIASNLVGERGYVKLDDPDNNSIIYQVGTIDDRQKVFVYQYADEKTAVVGYKGDNGDTDSGLFFSPYILLMTTGIVVNALTFQPVVQFMTRYGLASDEKSDQYFVTLTI